MYNSNYINYNKNFYMYNNIKKIEKENIFNYDRSQTIRNYGKISQIYNLTDTDLLELLKAISLLVSKDNTSIYKTISTVLSDIQTYRDGVKADSTAYYLSSFSSNELLDLEFLFNKFIYTTMDIENISFDKLIVLIAEYNRLRTTKTTSSQSSSQKTIDAKSTAEEVNKCIIEKFKQDILAKSQNESFRGWMLPNGQLLSQYNEKSDSNSTRQDHSKLFDIFMCGLEILNNESYLKIKDLYE